MYFERVCSYAVMRQIIEAFAAPDSRMGFVVVIGDPGIGKTNTFRKEMCPDAVVLECTTTPFGLYTELYKHKDAPIIVLDDVDTLMVTPQGLNILKALLQTDAVKTVAWNTAAADNAKIPRSFQVKARVIMFANTLPKGGGKNLDAVLDRGHCYRFTPNAQELHNEVKGWIDQNQANVDPEVFDFIGQNLPRILRPTFRDYVKASQSNAAGLDWRASLQARWDEDPKLTAAAEIMRLASAGDETLMTEKQRSERFAEWGHGSRSTYMEYQKKAIELMGWTRLPKAKSKANNGGTNTSPASTSKPVTTVSEAAKTKGSRKTPSAPKKAATKKAAPKQPRPARSKGANQAQVNIFEDGDGKPQNAA